VRVLLDESLPRPLAALLSGHEVRTVATVGWSGIENGELLRLAAERFDVLITADRNVEHQQNLITLQSQSSFSSLRPTASNRWHRSCLNCLSLSRRCRYASLSAIGG